MTITDLHSPEMSEAFANAPVYEKTATVAAILVVEPHEVVTVVGDGFVETTVIAQPGEYVVRNPGGERYVLPAEKFCARYIHLDGVLYQSKGLIRAFRNNTGSPVTILAPWGEEQHGDDECFFAQALDNPDIDRYIIENEAFFATYRLIG